MSCGVRLWFVLALSLIRMAGSTMLVAVYGYEVTSEHDPLVEVVEKALNHLNEAAIPASKFVSCGIFQGTN